MRTHNLFSRLGLAMVAILLLSSIQHVYAAGTMAGTVITNQASVQYNAGSNVRNGTSNSVSVTVGYKVSINLVAPSSTTTTVDSTILYESFKVYNSGNYTDNFLLTVGHIPHNWSAQLYQDLYNGVWNVLDPTVASGSTLSADTGNSIPLFLKITIPGYADAPDNMSDSVTVYAESNGAGPGPVVRVGGAGRQTYFANITIAQPVLSVTGAQTTTGSPAIPGSTFAYTLTLKNTGHAAIADGAALTFILNNNFNFTSATGTSPVVSAKDGSGNGGTVSWTLNHTDLPATMSLPLQLQVNVTIQQVTANGTGATAGNVITIMDSTASQKTTTKLVYNDGLNTHTIGTAPLSQVTVAQASGAYLAITTAAQSGNPGDTLTYTFTLRNGGNAANTFNLSQVKSGGVLDTLHVFMTTVDGQPVYTTASVPAGNTITIYVGLYVNVTGQNGNTIIRLLSAAPTSAGATPLGAGNYNPSITITTTVTAPILVIVMSDSAASGNVGTAANPAPGDVIYYIVHITNSGSGSATSVSSSNLTQTHTVYNANSVGVDATNSGTYTQMNDNTSASGVTIGANTGSTVQVVFSSIPSGVTSEYRYSVKIQ